MITLSKTRSLDPERYEIRRAGELIGRVEVRWGFCRAWLGADEIYTAHNHIFWHSFSNYPERRKHLDAIRDKVSTTLHQSTDNSA